MCEHIVGMLHYTDYSDVVTLEELMKYIRDEEEFNLYLDVQGRGNEKSLVWTLRDYADGRKSTNLRRFSYCPECGEKIDWKAIRKGENDGSNRENP